MSDDKTSPVRVTQMTRVRVTDARETKESGSARLEEKSRVMAVWNRGAAMSAGAAGAANAGRNPTRAGIGPGWPER